MRLATSLLLLSALLAACGESSPGATPVVPAGALTITEPASGTVVTSATVTVRGTAPAGARVVHDIRFRPDQETVADASGAWSIVVDLSSGENVLTFRIGDDSSTERSISVTLAASQATPRATPRPAATPQVTPDLGSGSFERVGRRAWQRILRAPDDHFGERLIVWACVTQFDAATGSDAFRGQASYQREDFWFSDGENAVFSGDATLLDDIFADDVVRIEAVVLGALTYETQIGGSTTVPSFRVVSIDTRGEC